MPLKRLVPSSLSPLAFFWRLVPFQLVRGQRRVGKDGRVVDLDEVGSREDLVTDGRELRRLALDVAAQLPPDDIPLGRGAWPQSGGTSGSSSRCRGRGGEGARRGLDDGGSGGLDCRSSEVAGPQHSTRARVLSTWSQST